MIEILITILILILANALCYLYVKKYDKNKN